MPINWGRKISGMWGSMRLICPNCDAQYEVDAHAIPAEGRDVQCSNCGHTWFHRPGDDSDEGDGAPVRPAQTPDAETAFSEARPESAAPRGQTSAPGHGWPATETGKADEGTPDHLHDDEIEDDWDDEDAEPYTPAAPRSEPGSTAAPRTPAAEPAATGSAAGTAAMAAGVPRRRELDENVAQLLREEAEREARARQAERGTLESQTDLGLDNALTKHRSRTSQAMRYDPFADDAVTDPQSARRRTLPDIEQINSTLSASNVHMENMQEEMTEPEPEEGRRGFRLGFGISLLVGLILLAIYAYTPQIIAWIPAAEPVLTAYGAGVDGLRGWLDQVMKNVILSINGAK